jgi:hypothetical protein
MWPAARRHVAQADHCASGTSRVCRASRPPDEHAVSRQARHQHPAPARRNSTRPAASIERGSFASDRGTRRTRPAIKPAHQWRCQHQRDLTGCSEQCWPGTCAGTRPFSVAKEHACPPGLQRHFRRDLLLEGPFGFAVLAQPFAIAISNARYRLIDRSNADVVDLHRFQLGRWPEPSLDSVESISEFQLLALPVVPA